MHGRTTAARLVKIPRSNHTGRSHTNAADTTAATISARPAKALAEYQRAGLDSVAGVRKPYKRLGPTTRSANGRAMMTRNKQIARATLVGTITSGRREVHVSASARPTRSAHPCARTEAARAPSYCH